MKLLDTRQHLSAPARRPQKPSQPSRRNLSLSRGPGESCASLPNWTPRNVPPRGSRLMDGAYAPVILSMPHDFVRVFSTSGFPRRCEAVFGEVTQTGFAFQAYRHVGFLMLPRPLSRGLRHCLGFFARGEWHCPHCSRSAFRLGIVGQKGMRSAHSSFETQCKPPSQSAEISPGQCGCRHVDTRYLFRTHGLVFVYCNPGEILVLRETK